MALIIAINLFSILTYAYSSEDRIPFLSRDLNSDTLEYFLPIKEFKQSFSLLRDPVTLENQETINPRVNLAYVLYGITDLFLENPWLTNAFVTFLLTTATCLVIVLLSPPRWGLWSLVFCASFYVGGFALTDGIFVIKKFVSLAIPALSPHKQLGLPVLLSPTRTLFYLLLFALLFLWLKYVADPSLSKRLIPILGILFATSFFVHFYLAGMFAVLLTLSALFSRDLMRSVIVILLYGVPSLLLFLSHTVIFASQRTASDVYLRLGVFVEKVLVLPSVIHVAFFVLFLLLLYQTTLDRRMKIVLALIIPTGILLDNIGLLGFPSPQPGNNSVIAAFVLFPFFVTILGSEWIAPWIEKQSKIGQSSAKIATSFLMLFVLALVLQNIVVFKDRNTSLYTNGELAKVLHFVHMQTPDDSVVLANQDITDAVLVYSHNNAYIPLGFASLSSNEEIVQRFVEGNLLLGKTLPEIREMLHETRTLNILFHHGWMNKSDIGFSVWGPTILWATTKSPIPSIAEHTLRTQSDALLLPSYALHYVIVSSADRPKNRTFEGSQILFQNQNYIVYRWHPLTSTESSA